MSSYKDLSKIDRKDLKELARFYTYEVVTELMELIRDRETPHKVRLAAMALVLDRGHGRPVQMNINYEPPTDVSMMKDEILLDRFDNQLKVIQPFVEDFTNND